MNVNFIELTSSEYLALTTVDDKSFYYLTDTEELFQGEKKLSYKEWSGTQAQFETASAAGQIANGTIVTITDAPAGSGDLDEHIESFVYSSSGIHGIRYQNNVLQVYNSTTEQWENASTAVTVDQTYDGTSTNAQSGVAIDSALTGGAVTKVGTTDVGSTSTPIYLANGTPTIITPDSTPTSGSSNLITSGGVYTGVSNKLATSVAGDEYDSTATYSAGDYVIYNNTLYKVINGCTGVLPTDTNEFTPTSINAELASVNSNSTSWILFCSQSYSSEINIALPSSFNEIKFFFYGKVSKATTDVYNYYLLKDEWDNMPTNSFLRGGYYLASLNYGNFAVQKYDSNTIRTRKVTTAKEEATTTIRIYYR